MPPIDFDFDPSQVAGVDSGGPRDRPLDGALILAVRPEVLPDRAAKVAAVPVGGLRPRARGPRAGRVAGRGGGIRSRPRRRTSRTHP